MGRIRRVRPSAGLVVAMVALIAALGGVAAAGPIRKALTRTKVVTIADQEISSKAPGLSVSHAKTADTAGSASSANHATQADNAGFAANAGALDGSTDNELA